MRKVADVKTIDPCSEDRKGALSKVLGFCLPSLTLIL